MLGETLLFKLYNFFDDSTSIAMLVNANRSELSIICDNASINQTFSKSPVHVFNLSDWGPKRDSLYIVIPITLLYILIFVTGLLGNVCTCVVIARNKSMHTATNYYLFSLAISDLLLLISGLPTEIYSTWSKYPYIFGEIFCILQGFAAETSANATVLTITAFTIERYMAICYPFLSHTMSKLSRAIKFVIVIWLLAMCLALPQAMSFGIFYEQLPDGHNEINDHYVCTVTRVIIPHAFEISTFVFFVAPMTVITILYILIGIKIHKSTSGRARDGSVRLKHRKNKTFVRPSNIPRPNSVENQVDKVQLTYAYEEEGRKNYARNSQASKHVVKMLIAVVSAFFICWAPFHAQRLLAIYAQPDSPNMITIFNILTYVSGVFYYLSTSINPLLYHIMSHKFRVAFQEQYWSFRVEFLRLWSWQSSPTISDEPQKDTIMRFLRRKSSANDERCYSALSGRSSQVNSHSNTDSCSQQSSIRYLETEMRRLRDSRRPLVVSFRRKQPSVQKVKRVTVLDVELQKALDSLSEESTKIDKETRFQRVSRNSKKYNDIAEHQRSSWTTLNPDFGLIELHNLQSSSRLPSNGILTAKWQNCSKKDIELIRQQQLKLNNTKRSYCKLNFNKYTSCNCEQDNHMLTKSCTMPDINNLSQI